MDVTVELSELMDKEVELSEMMGVEGGVGQGD